MRGIHVYGALLMVFGFVIGLQHQPGLVACVVVSAALAAAAEATNELAEFTHGPSQLIWQKIQTFLAFASWGATACTTLITLVIIGGF